MSASAIRCSSLTRSTGLNEMGSAASVAELAQPTPAATPRDHCVDLSGALFVATAANVDSVPAMLWDHR